MKIRNLYVLGAIFCVSAALMSCNKVKTITVDKTFANIVMTITETNDVGVQRATAELTGIQQFAKDNNFDVNDITEINAKSCIVEIQDVSTTFTRHTFDVLDNVSMSISSPGVSSALMAELTPPHNGSTREELKMTTLNVKEYLSADKFLLEGSFQNNDTITHSFPVSITVTFEVKADVKSSRLGF